MNAGQPVDASYHWLAAKSALPQHEQVKLPPGAPASLNGMQRPVGCSVPACWQTCVRNA